MGLMNLHGLGTHIDVEAAVKHFQIAKNDSRAINALGYIYYNAPDYLETDPVILN